MELREKNITPIFNWKMLNNVYGSLLINKDGLNVCSAIAHCFLMDNKARTAISWYSEKFCIKPSVLISNFNY